MDSVRKHYVSEWKMEDLGFSRSQNTLGRERRQLKKRVKRTIARNHKNDDAWKNYAEQLS